ncbi:MAG: HEPN domain-containing protein [Candidatus Poribacteria bacterium]|nr:HEPN domain-containing protein [Candidatus Poribacteria bacterium]
MRYATEDIALAERIVDEEEFAGSVCFHAQQCAEKCLKAFLTIRGVEAELTHDLGKLCRQCLALDEVFDIWLPKIAGMSRYAVEPRYPFQDYPSIEQSREAVQTARELYDFTPTRITPPDDAPPQ